MSAQPWEAEQTGEAEPLVSFVVLSYNFEAFLPECLASILAQRGGYPFEVVVVDDASTDGTAALLGAFDDPRIRVIRHTQNLGHARTVEDGLHAARGRYVARIDGDDRYRPDFLEMVVPILERHPEVGLVYGDAALIDAAGRETAPCTDTAHGGRDFKGNELVALLECNFICAPTVIARREAWRAALPVPSFLAFHDWYFTLSIARTYAFYYVHRVLADYRVHGSNMHARTIRDRTEVPSIFWMLDKVYAESEADPALERAKQAARRQVYGRHCVTYADKYFGVGYDGEARRLYLDALRYRPAYALNAGLLRRLAATFIGRARYERAKALLRMQPA
ncbi:MAG TPA: glycosyltransferase [Rubricoccaceae bacterium]|nr:glycosyltransferase [Rubricoccaceae bacterium]